MTKEEKIKEAWFKIGIDNLEHIEGNQKLGWRSNSGVKYDTWDGRFEVNNFFHRPKELTGIEDNNGWILISEKLPKLGDKIIFCINTTPNHFEEFTFVTSEFLGTYEYFGVTHWKYNESKPPIF